jgi:septum formation protein
MRQIILASQSPRRRELLADMGVEFDVVVSDVDEHIDHTISGAALAMELAELKARAVADKYPEAIVIGADTVVSVGGQNLAKPEDEVEATAMLRSLCGRTHEVSTGVMVICKATGFAQLKSETAHITMNDFDAEKVAVYIATGDPYDKAGGYAIQNPDAQFLIKSFTGDKTTIIGLPQTLVRTMLQEAEQADTLVQ